MLKKVLPLEKNAINIAYFIEYTSISLIIYWETNSSWTFCLELFWFLHFSLWKVPQFLETPQSWANRDGWSHWIWQKKKKYYNIRWKLSYFLPRFCFFREPEICEVAMYVSFVAGVVRPGENWHWVQTIPFSCFILLLSSPPHLE